MHLSKTVDKDLRVMTNRHERKYPIEYIHRSCCTLPSHCVLSGDQAAFFLFL